MRGRGLLLLLLLLWIARTGKHAGNNFAKLTVSVSQERRLLGPGLRLSVAGRNHHDDPSVSGSARK